MIHSFRNYLETKVSFLDDLLTALAIVQRKRRMKAPQPKKEILIDKIPVSAILGVSKTAVGKQYSLIGESKTIIPDLSLYMHPEETEVTGDVSQSICISLVNEDTDEVDLSEEEIKLDTVQATATGVSIEDIEIISKVEKESESLSPLQANRIRNTVGVLSGAELELKNDPEFSKRLNQLLENCEQAIQPEISASQLITGDIENFFN